MTWTRERLEAVARARLDGVRLVVVANREPFIHIYEGDEIRCLRPASGLTTAIDPLMRACGGVWVGHGSGSADRDAADERGRLAVPPEDPEYTLRRVWLTPEEERGYYYGFANEALWPLCHNAFTRPQFRAQDWDYYRQVNRKFAAAVLDEIGEEPAIVFVQDYHFALLPRMLKDRRPDLVVAQFWHIPWPSRDQFAVCPWQDELLDGLLGNDLLSFHIPHHCNNFLETVDRALESKINREHAAVTRRGQTTVVRPHPISVDPDLIARLGPVDGLREERRLRGRLRLGDLPLLIGVDRVDYIKGIPERLRAVDRLLELHPEHKGKFAFLQIGAPSREQIGSYRQLGHELDCLVEEINNRHGGNGWSPIVWLHEHYNAEQLCTLYRAAAGCVVSSLHDGMNLVAKEFVASRTDQRGVLVLSQFTGAASELTDAVLVNPHDLDELAEGLHQALTMPEPEQEWRMRRMRQQVADYNIYRWGGLLLTEVARFLPAHSICCQPQRHSDPELLLEAHG
ncbi:MAG: trehalose-6-phosphate synthase [Planctomycetia bacterium]|nr:trehalose-6-phosphate synthase [Planctomycetia bacterium]